ncbi:MAG: hydroxymethylglutaryl-CoA lyase [Alphaproteobacteria bacterium]|nr:hydroxymethylglutaryl-CoA lyase [Alphaproteobacteria bacterium]
MAEKIVINEVGLRDGLQMQPKFVSTEGKLELARALLDAGVTSFEASSFVSPKAVPQMADASDVFAGLPPRDDVDYWALVPNEKGFDRAVEAGVRNIAVVLSVTDTMNRENINMSVAESAAVFERVLARCQAEGLRSRAYVAVAFVCPFEGVTPVDTVVKWTDVMLSAGAEKVAIADTIGAGTPTQCKDLMSTLVGKWGPERFALHLHDTQAMALTLAWVGAQEGVRTFDSSIGGLGGCPFAPGAAGNVATEDLVFMFESSGFETGIDIGGLRRAVKVAERLTGLELGGRITKYLRSQEAKAAQAAE